MLWLLKAEVSKKDHWSDSATALPSSVVTKTLPVPASVSFVLSVFEVGRKSTLFPTKNTGIELGNIER